MKFYAGMTYNSQYDYWSINFARMTESDAQIELARLHGKGCDDIRLFVVEEIPRRPADQQGVATDE